MEGVWFLQGTSTTRGPYNGELELRKSNDGTYNVVRIVTYINYFFLMDSKVQEVWQERAVATGDSIAISYDLKQGDFITKLNGQKREPTDFRNGITVISRFVVSPVGLKTQFSDKKVSDYSEWITTKRNLDPKPLWVNERKNMLAKGKEIPSSVRNTIKTFKNQIAFDKDSLVKSYRNRPEFK